jgi:hypothetical protein
MIKSFTLLISINAGLLAFTTAATHAAGVLTVQNNNGANSAATPTLVSAYLVPKGGATTMVTGSTLQFFAYGVYSDGSVGKLPDARGNSVTGWNTSKHSVAIISMRGHVTAMGAGTVNIGAAIGSLHATPWTVTVSKASVVPPPTISCSASPSIMNQGGTATITAVGGSSKSLPLTYSYSTSAGSISGIDSAATLETSGASAGIVTVTCTVDQQGGGTASATTTLLVQSLSGVQALTAFQFTDSVGVNVHLGYGDTVYATQFPQIMQSMISLGVKHFRDVLNQAQPFQYQNAEALGKSGIKADWIMDINNSASDIGSAYTNAPDATAGFEGPNEDDAAAGPTILAFMQLLHNTVQGNPATAAMPVIAPSFIQPASFATQGNLSSLINFGNTHDYFGTRNPETAPYGGGFYNCGGYGSMQFNICLAQVVSVGEPVVSTETGYESGTGLSDAIIGRYEVRTLFESLNLGINRTYLYELIDEPSSGDWGLLTGSFAPRPAYTAIKNLLSLLQDVNFAQPGKLDYTLAGQTQNVNQVLLQKSNGGFYLAIWLGLQDADPDNPSSIYNVAPQNVTLTANTPVGGATTYILDDSGNMTSTSAQLTNGSLPIAVTDRITLVALSSGQSH